ncbi:MAG: BrnA antitoxin family protein [gamma proteobacterium symbiont of Taylorina sp.]|nr:BrnA antitoxin family protein [gamma proteobacterium symbiont of Taylorina sp.]
MKKPLIDKDGEVKELTDEFFKAAKPASEVLPQILGSEVANDLLKRKQGDRGKQKKPLKIGVFARYDPNVIEFFKATGKGWQTRMNDVLAKYVASH